MTNRQLRPGTDAANALAQAIYAIRMPPVLVKQSGLRGTRVLYTNGTGTLLSRGPRQAKLLGKEGSGETVDTT